MNTIFLNYEASLSGKVKNSRLSANKGLFAVFEAIANSIYAIKQKRDKYDSSFVGNIIIKLIRENTLVDEMLGRIDSFVIKDDGIGFTQDNMNSFLTFDSIYKEKVGGRGNGRFLWLKVFSNASIDSTWREGDAFYNRKFAFNELSEGLTDAVSDADNKETYTSISLEHIKEPYASRIPNKLSDISSKIMNHFVVDLINANCPKIYVIDKDITICLNDLFAQKYVYNDSKTDFLIDGHEFTLFHLRIRDNDFGYNKLYYCANERLVDERKLGEHVPNLSGILFDTKEFWYLGVLTGEYLDANVDASRQSFNIEEEESDSLFSTLSKQKINKETIARVKDYLKEELESIETTKEKRINSYINEQAPEYKTLLKYKKHELSKIKPGSSDAELEESLSKIRHEFEKETKDECDTLVEKVGTKSITAEQYQNEFNMLIQKVSEMNQSILAKYVAKRRIVINLFKQGLVMKNDGKFELESYMHELIYPMGKTSDNCNYDSHNLWLIDEKLSYSVYIASDKPFNNDRKEKRPDIMVLNNPVAMADSDNDGTEFSSVTLFELKRPGRDDYTPLDNPVDQLLDYVTRIKEGNVRDANGRTIRVNDNTKFYLFIVADVTNSLTKILNKHSFTFNGIDNAYSHNQNYNAYLEVLSYDRILRDAEKRNRVFFDKLGV